MCTGELHCIVAQYGSSTTKGSADIKLELLCVYAQSLSGLIQRIAVLVLDKMCATVATVHAWATTVITQAPLHVAQRFQDGRGDTKLLSCLIKSWPKRTRCKDLVKRRVC